jgi:hypothetical protein
MRRVILLVAATLASVLHAEAAETGCGSFALPVDGRNLDLAPPHGFVEICGQDANLCRTLTAGYPPSVPTLGYFVSPEDWKRFKSGPPIGFTRYLDSAGDFHLAGRLARPEEPSPVATGCYT